MEISFLRLFVFDFIFSFVFVHSDSPKLMIWAMVVLIVDRKPANLNCQNATLFIEARVLKKVNLSATNLQVFVLAFGPCDPMNHLANLDITLMLGRAVVLRLSGSRFECRRAFCLIFLLLSPHESLLSITRILLLQSPFPVSFPW